MKQSAEERAIEFTKILKRIEFIGLGEGDLEALTKVISGTYSKVGTVTRIMGDLCIIKLDGFTVRKGDVLFVAKDD